MAEAAAADDGDGDRGFWDALYTSDVDAITEHLELDDIDLDQGDDQCGYETPLMRLCHSEINEEDSAAILELMLMKNISINVQDIEGRTGLCHACMAGRCHVIQRLSRVKECDPNVQDNYGNTALMFGVYFGDVQAIGTLLTSFTGNGPGVDITIKNNEDITAIMIAHQNGYSDIAEYLEQYLNWSLAIVPNEVPTKATNQTRDHPVGGRVRNFRRRKLKHALGPLVVPNKLQTSKSADYSQYKGHVMPEADPSDERQYSYSAGAYQSPRQAHVIDQLYRQTEDLNQENLYEDDEFESDDDDDDSDSESMTTQLAGAEYQKSRQRRGSNSLPNLHEGRNQTVIIPPLKLIQGDTPSGDEGYETRSSQCTVSREELLLPNLPEGGVVDDEEDYTPRTRRGSFSLPDLRGLQREELKGSSTNSTPRLWSGSSKDSTPRAKMTPKGASTILDLTHDNLADIQKFIGGEYDGQEYEDEEPDEFEKTLTFNQDVCTPRDIGLKLPSMSETNSVVNTPRILNLPEINSSRTSKQTTMDTMSQVGQKLTKLTPKEHKHLPNVSAMTPRTKRKTDINLTLETPRTTRSTSNRQKVLLDRA